jgi:hypothetical protein
MPDDHLHMSPIEFDSDLVLQDILTPRLISQIDQVIKSFDSSFCAFSFSV